MLGWRSEICSLKFLALVAAAGAPANQDVEQKTQKLSVGVTMPPRVVFSILQSQIKFRYDTGNRRVIR